MVKANEVKQIIEGILRDRDNIQKLRRVVNIIICDYMSGHRARVGFPSSKYFKVYNNSDKVAYNVSLKPSGDSEAVN